MAKNLAAEAKANSALYKVTTIIAKIAEVLHWCLAGGMLVFAICTTIWTTPVTEWVNIADLSNGAALAGFSFGNTIILALLAMIFRNVYLILKTAKGKTWFAKGKTPFQKDIVRMLREIGIFFIAITVLDLILNIIVRALGGEAGGVDWMSVFTGLVFICISQFFNYGLGLEKDLDGLV